MRMRWGARCRARGRALTVRGREGPRGRRRIAPVPAPREPTREWPTGHAGGAGARARGGAIGGAPKVLLRRDLGKSSGRACASRL